MSQGGAADQLTRILYMIPAATREGGVGLEELARELEVAPKAVMRDLTEVTHRVYYHPAGSGSALQIELTGDRVHIWTTGDFKRPMRLSRQEALCVGLALRSRGADGGAEADGGAAADRGAAADGDAEADRGAAADGDAEKGETPTLLDKLERQVATAPAGELLNQLDTADLRQKGTGIRTSIGRSLRNRACLAIQYLKPGDTEPLDRVVHPHALAHGEGNWYLLAYCETSEEIRNFRVDRILGAVCLDQGFEPRTDFDPKAATAGGRVFVGGEEMAVRVRYSPGIARWIAERESGEWDPDGGFTVTHRVVDPHWIVRHVLQYGAEAEVLEPEEAREWVVEGVPRAPAALPSND